MLSMLVLHPTSSLKPSSTSWKHLEECSYQLAHTIRPSGRLRKMLMAESRRRSLWMSWSVPIAILVLLICSNLMTTDFLFHCHNHDRFPLKNSENILPYHYLPYFLFTMYDWYPVGWHTGASMFPWLMQKGRREGTKLGEWSHFRFSFVSFTSSHLSHVFLTF